MTHLAKVDRQIHAEQQAQLCRALMLDMIELARQLERQPVETARTQAAAAVQALHETAQTLESYAVRIDQVMETHRV